MTHMITNNHSWSLGTCPNKSLVLESPVRPHQPGGHLTPENDRIGVSVTRLLVCTLCSPAGGTLDISLRRPLNDAWLNQTRFVTSQVPQGRSKIAHRFIGGIDVTTLSVPQGRKKTQTLASPYTIS